MNMDQTEKKCIELIIHELPGLVCQLKQDFCAPEVSHLTIQQHRILSKLYEVSHTTTDLAKELKVSLPAISRMVSGLMKKGWVEKKSDKDDARKIYLFLSKKGQMVLDLSRKQSSAKLFLKLKVLSAKKKETLIEAIEILNSIIATTEKEPS